MTEGLRQINSEILNFQTKEIQVVPGLTFNQYQNILDIYFYHNSKFKSGDIDDEGDRKYFLNINKNPCKVFSKAIDFDTKNIRLLTTGGGDPQKTWFMERDLKYWMRDKQFGKILNRLFMELPIFGTVVLKVVNGYPYFVDLRNFVVEQSAETLDDSSYIIEIHNFTPARFRQVAKEMKWDQAKVKETLDMFYKMKGVSHIRLYERYGEVGETQPDGTMTYSYKRVFFADVGQDEFDNYNNLTTPKQGVELASDDFDGHPYWEFHAEKVPGRWQGIGVVEALIEPQIATNYHQNLQSKTAAHLALLLFQSRSTDAAGNLLTEKKNGDVIIADSEVTQVVVQDRNGQFFNDQHNRWQANRDELTFAYDVVQGERLPAGTPLGSAQIAQSQTLSYFEQIQENVALDVKEMLYEVILPQFEKENTKEHTLRLVGQDLDTYISMVKNEMVFKEVTKLALKSLDSDLPFPTNADRDAIGIAIEESIRQGREKILTVPEGFYKGLKYDIDIDITGESVDTRVRYATKFAILQAITADPTMTTDPVKKKFLYSMAEDGGLSPNDFFQVESKPIEQLMVPPTGSGGGVSTPSMGMSMAGQSNATV